MTAIKANQNSKFFTAIRAIQDAKSIFKDDSGSTLLHGALSARVHNYKGAIKHYHEALALTPSHTETLLSLIEIHFFLGNYSEAAAFIQKVNRISLSRFNQRDPLLDFKLLVCLERLSQKDPAKYTTQLKKMYELYDFNDDHPYCYFSTGLKLMIDHKKQGIVSITKAFLIFRDVDKVNFWSKALVDFKYIEEYRLMFELRSQDEINNPEE